MNTSLIILLLVSAVIYFIPSIIAWRRDHHQGGAILLTNVFLGWTFLGWVVALVWSVSHTNGNTPQNTTSSTFNKKSKTQTIPNTDNKICPECAETVKSAAKVCRFCQHKFNTTPNTISYDPKKRVWNHRGYEIKKIEDKKFGITGVDTGDKHFMFVGDAEDYINDNLSDNT